MISGKGINRLLRSYDCIVPEKLIFNYSVKKHYEKYHLLSDWKLLGEVIEARCPQYGHDFIDIGEQYWMYPYNMIIAKQKVFDAYCEWLFPILDDLYGIIDVSDRDAYQKRAIGFLSERLMALWLIHNNVSLVERPVMQIE